MRGVAVKIHGDYNIIAAAHRVARLLLRLPALYELRVQAMAGAVWGGGARGVPASSGPAFAVKHSPACTPGGRQMREDSHGAASHYGLTKTVPGGASLIDAANGAHHTPLFELHRPRHHYVD